MTPHENRCRRLCRNRAYIGARKRVRDFAACFPVAPQLGESSRLGADVRHLRFAHAAVRTLRSTSFVHLHATASGPQNRVDFSMNRRVGGH